LAAGNNAALKIGEIAEGRGQEAGHAANIATSGRAKQRGGQSLWTTAARFAQLALVSTGQIC